MPWFDKPKEYICDDCEIHYLNGVNAAQPIGGGFATSPVTPYGGGSVTRCKACATQRNQNFKSDVSMQGKSLVTTITYRIHNGKNYTFLGQPTPTAAMAGATQQAMMASGALNLMDHPAYGAGKIRPPGAFSGPNLSHDALAAWPGAAGMGRHHVHVGANGQTRVLFGLIARPYPAPHAAWTQSIVLYIGS